MNFKEKVLKALNDAEAREMGPARTVIRECRELVENLIEEEKMNERCAMPDYEAMYYDASARLEESVQIQARLLEENRCMRMELIKLQGFKEAAELIFRKDSGCRGC